MAQLLWRAVGAARMTPVRAPAPSSPRVRVLASIFAVFVAFVGWASGARAASPDPGVTPVALELFVMSQCPYALGAEAAVRELAGKFGPNLAVRLEYIGQAKPDGTLASMHGRAEVTGDIAQLCAQKHVERWHDFIACQNEDPDEVDKSYLRCTERVGGSAQRMQACVEGAEGKALATTSFKRSAERGARGSPTFHIAGERYEGGRRPADLGRAVCSAYTGSKPRVCAEFPEGPRVDIAIVTDSRCPDCEPERLERALRRLLVNPRFRRLDYVTPEGKSLHDAAKLVRLPAAVFGPGLDADKLAAETLTPFLRAEGPWRALDEGATWEPRCVDPGGCKLQGCEKLLSCRPEAPRRVELFVMSQCPYAVRALDSLRDVMRDLRRENVNLDVRMHYIGDGDETTGFGSLHGKPEVEEDLRWICAAAHYPKNARYLDYVWCRADAIDDAARAACATPATGFDAAMIEGCATGPEGKRLLARSFAYSSELGIAGSPSWIVNGRFPFAGSDRDTIRRELCRRNSMPGCPASLQAPR
jgi:2-hydroxychromene-2-carboxylate isomerase